VSNEMPSTPMWSPEYPAVDDARVELLEYEVETYISDRRPALSIAGYAIDSPAVFWTDKDHIYVRLNWKQWCPISKSNPGHVAAICSSHYCNITSSYDNEIGSYMAIVYRVEELPREIFATAEEKAAEEEALAAKEPSKEYVKCLERVSGLLQKVGNDTSVFPNVDLDGDHVAIAVSTDKVAVLMDILPEDRDFTFCPSTGENLHNPMNKWDSDVISLDFVAKLRRIADVLKQNEEDSIAKIGLVANWNTLSNFRDIAEVEGIDDLCLFTYDHLEEEVSKIFKQHLESKRKA